MKEKVNNQVLFDQVSRSTHRDCSQVQFPKLKRHLEDKPASALQSNYDKMKSEVPKYKMITPSILADRLRVCWGCPAALPMPL